MGEFPHRLVIFRMRLRFAQSEVCVNGRQRSVSCRRSERLVRGRPLRIERTDLAVHQGLGRSAQDALGGDSLACRGYVTMNGLIRSRQKEDPLAATTPAAASPTTNQAR